jgi:hypothetical protein
VTTEVTRRGSWDRRRIIFGDWTWLVRDPLDVLRLVFIAGTVAFAVMGRSTAVGLTAASAVLLIARIADLPRWFDFTLIVAMTAIAWGTALSLYGDYFFYDNVVHSVSPFCYSPVLYISLVRLDVLPDPARVHSVSRRAGIFISTLALGMAVGAGYEVVEWSSDKLLGTHLVKSIDDTGSDLLEDTCGSLVAAILVTVWSTRRWTSRRIPGERSTVGRFGRLRAWAARFRPRPGSPVEILEHRLGGIPLAGKIVAEIAAGTVLLVWPSPALRTVEIVVGVALAVRAVSDIIELVRGGGGYALRLLVEIAVDVAVAALVLAAPGAVQSGVPLHDRRGYRRVRIRGGGSALDTRAQLTRSLDRGRLECGCAWGRHRVARHADARLRCDCDPARDLPGGAGRPAAHPRGGAQARRGPHVVGGPSRVAMPTARPRLPVWRRGS